MTEDLVHRALRAIHNAALTDATTDHGARFDTGLTQALVGEIETLRGELRTPTPPQRHGLYRLRWKSGGCSLAAVGSQADGTRWYAPCNWISVPSTDWSAIESYELMCDMKELQ